MKYILAILVPLSLWSMNGLYQIGYGTSSKGMGGVCAALPQDSLVIAINPAGLSHLCKRVDMGLCWLKEETDTQLEKHLHSNQNFVFPELGAVYSLPCRLTAGIAFFRKGTLATDYGTPSAVLGTTPLAFLIDQYYLSPSLAWAINSCHSIGIALNVSYNRFEARGRENAILTSIHPTDVTDRGVDAEWGFGVTIGWLGQLTDCLILGASYETHNWVDKFARYRGLLPGNGNASTPSSFWLGAAYFLCENFVVASDLGYHFWRTIPTYGNSETTSSLNGSEKGPGLGWCNQFVLKLGAALDFLPCWTARLGYNFGQDVVQKKGIIANTLVAASPLHHLTAGLSYVWQCHEFSIAYIHGFANKRGEKTREMDVSIRGENDQISLSWSRRF